MGEFWTRRSGRAGGRTRGRARGRGGIGDDSQSADADDDDDDDDDDDVPRGVALTGEQRRIAAIALDALYAREAEEGMGDERERTRATRLRMILGEAVARARRTCEGDERANACVEAWEEVNEIRDAANRAGVGAMGGMDSGGWARRDDAEARGDDATRRAEAAEMRARLRKDPLMGAQPCSRLGECTVAEGTLEARGRFARAFDEEEDGRSEVDPKRIEEAVRRAMKLCASGSSAECSLAWEEVEDLSNWGGKRGRTGD